MKLPSANRRYAIKQARTRERRKWFKWLGKYQGIGQIPGYNIFLIPIVEIEKAQKGEEI